MSPYSSEVIRQTEMTAPLNSLRIKKKFETTNFANGDINFIGDCCFAYSPQVDANTVLETLLEFQTGPSFLKCHFYYTGYMGPDGGSSSAGLRGICSIYFNDNSILQIMSDNDSGNMAQTYGPELIIPPFTKVKVSTTSVSSTADYVAQCAVVGKVYSGAEVIQGAI